MPGIEPTTDPAENAAMIRICPLSHRGKRLTIHLSIWLIWTFYNTPTIMSIANAHARTAGLSEGHPESEQPPEDCTHRGVPDVLDEDILGVPDRHGAHLICFFVSVVFVLVRFPKDTRARATPFDR